METVKKRVVVGLSGGVDSSVAAYLLQKSGYEVIGLFMKNWDDPNDPHCSAYEDYQDVIRVAEKLNIPYYSVNFSEQYKKNVFDLFLEELKANRTPNPDILCNREIKFKVFFDYAKRLGADYVATGHYAQVEHTISGGKLLKAQDQSKDQTYFLHAISGEVLNEVLFPLGHLNKKEVRAMAHDLGLVNAQKKDSTGICFIGERPFKEFVEQYIKKTQGHFVNENGQILGTHDGLCFYTLGQRKGLGIGGPGEPWFVADKKIETNEIVLVQGEEHPSLYKNNLIANQITWINEAPHFPLQCQAKIRYRQTEVECIVYQKENELWVHFPDPQRAITPGQSVVLYVENECIGGAVIQRSFNSFLTGVTEALASNP